MADEVKTKPRKLDPDGNAAGDSAVTPQRIRDLYASGLVTKDASGNEVVTPLSPQQVADELNVDVYWVLKYVDPDHATNVNIEGE